jgi:DNA-binding LacI/PurR family transcriptional regulator
MCPFWQRNKETMAVTLSDVARKAGVSKSAASRTFTRGASVSEKTRLKVERAAAELGYNPNVLASSLTTGRTKLVGLISNNFANPYFLEVFDCFTRHLQDAGLRPLLVNLSHAQDAERSLRLLLQYNVDGVIVASSTLPPSFAAAFHRAGLPIVHAFGWSAATPRNHLASIDNIESGRLAARSLLARGYQRIAFLGGPKEAATTQDRLAGFLQAARGAEVSLSFTTAYSYAAGRTEMQQLLLRGRPSQAYFCGDDVIAIGAMSAAKEVGLRIPDDIGFLGLNDMAMAGWQQINLTTIRQPLDAIISATVTMIRESIDVPERPIRTQLFPCEIVERGTLLPLL